MTISKRISRQELVEMYEFAVNQLAAAQEENKRLRDAYRTIEFISKYDGKDNNRRSAREEFIFIKVKAMDCVDRIKKSKSVPNGENDE